MKVAVLSLGWPPLWGGGEVYPHRLVEALCSEGVDAWGITPVPEVEEQDNGSAPVIRVLNREILELAEGRDYGYKIIPCLKEPSLKHLITKWLDQIEEEIDYKSFDCAIVLAQKIPLTEDEGHIEQVKKLFPKFVTLSYDFDRHISAELENDVLHTKSYDKTLEYFRSIMKDENEEGVTLQDELSKLPLTKTHVCEGEQGRIHITDFNEQVVECFFGTGNSIVFHPPLDETWWTSDKRNPNFNDPFTVGFINPIPRKGRQHLRHLITDNPNIHFKILGGGWGDGVKGFEDYIALGSKLHETPIPTNYEIIKYVKDIQTFYDEIDVFLFPSAAEGYGQVATEAISRGCPVICKQYPTIEEASGNGAKYVNREEYLNMEAWNQALHDVKDNYPKWLNQTEQTKQHLHQRQTHESKSLKAFLESIVNS